MVHSPLPALRSEYEEIARRLESVTGGAEREAVKREIIAYFKQVDSLIGELSALKEEVRKVVDRFKQVSASTAEASAPEFTGTRPAVHADHIGASTFNEKGWSLISLGDYAGAIQALHKALQLSPGETQAESLVGWAQMLHEDYDDALGTFQKVLMKEPANSLARINVGYICLKKRIFGEAIEHLSKAIRLDNDKKATLYAHFYLGLVYLQREMFEDAETFFEKTIKLGPNLIEAYYELGRAHWFAGDQAKAKSTWEDGFKANKFNPWGKKCQEMLELVAKGEEPPRESCCWPSGRPTVRPSRCGMSSRISRSAGMSVARCPSGSRKGTRRSRRRSGTGSMHSGSTGSSRAACAWTSMTSIAPCGERGATRKPATRSPLPPCCCSSGGAGNAVSPPCSTTCHRRSRSTRRCARPTTSPRATSSCAGSATSARATAGCRGLRQWAFSGCRSARSSRRSCCSGAGATSASAPRWKRERMEANCLTSLRLPNRLQPLMPDQTLARSRLRFGPKNYIVLGGALVSLVLGYWLLSRGSTTLAPVLLVLGYCVLLPVGLAL